MSALISEIRENGDLNGIVFVNSIHFIPYKSIFDYQNAQGEMMALQFIGKRKTNYVAELDQLNASEYIVYDSDPEQKSTDWFYNYYPGTPLSSTSISLSPGNIVSTNHQNTFPYPNYLYLSHHSQVPLGTLDATINSFTQVLTPSGKDSYQIIDRIIYSIAPTSLGSTIPRLGNYYVMEIDEMESKKYAESKAQRMILSLQNFLPHLTTVRSLGLGIMPEKISSSSSFSARSIGVQYEIYCRTHGLPAPRFKDVFTGKNTRCLYILPAPVLTTSAAGYFFMLKNHATMRGKSDIEILDAIAQWAFERQVTNYDNLRVPMKFLNLVPLGQATKILRGFQVICDDEYYNSQGNRNRNYGKPILVNGHLQFYGEILPWFQYSQFRDKNGNPLTMNPMLKAVLQPLRQRSDAIYNFFSQFDASYAAWIRSKLNNGEIPY